MEFLRASFPPPPPPPTRVRNTLFSTLVSDTLSQWKLTAFWVVIPCSSSHTSISEESAFTMFSATARASCSGTRPSVCIVTLVRTLHRREIWSSHSSVDEHSTLLWHDVCTGVQLPRFTRSLLPWSSAVYTRRQIPCVSNAIFSVYSYACCLRKRGPEDEETCIIKKQVYWNN